ncbi:HEPN domain-containing protein [Enterococcus sp. LJL120]
MVKISNPNLFDSFEMEGIWSTDADFKNFYAGKLTYKIDANESNLELDLYNSTFKFQEELPIFYGKTDTSEWITLIDCRVTRTNETLISKQKLEMQKIIIGPSVLSQKEMTTFRKVSFSFYLLNEWMSKLSTEQMEHLNFAMSDIKNNTYSLDAIEAIMEERVVRRNDYQITKFKMEVEQFYILKFKKEKSIDEIYNQTYLIVQFFYFLFSQRLPMKFIEFEIESPDSGKYPPKTYRMYFKQIAEVPSNSRKQVHDLISYNEIYEKIGGYINRWLEIYSQMRTIIQTYVGDLQLKSFVETEFLNAIRNIEVFHRTILEKKTAIPVETDNVRRQLIKFLENEEKTVRDYFIKRINHTEEGTLSNRLKESISILPDYLNKYIKYQDRNPSASRKRFIRSCVQTRNYITHGNVNKSDYQPLLEGKNLLIATRILNMIAEYYIMRQIGIDDEIIKKKYTNNPRYRLLQYHVLE